MGFRETSGKELPATPGLTETHDVASILGLKLEQLKPIPGLY